MDVSVSTAGERKWTGGNAGLGQPALQLAGQTLRPSDEAMRGEVVKGLGLGTHLMAKIRDLSGGCLT